MMAASIILKANNYPDELLLQLQREVEEKSSYCDVHLICDDGCIPVHRLILLNMAKDLCPSLPPDRSNVFMDAVRGAHHHHSLEAGTLAFTLAEVKTVHLKAVVSLIYRGEAVIPEGDKMEVEGVIKMLQLDLLCSELTTEGTRVEPVPGSPVPDQPDETEGEHPHSQPTTTSSKPWESGSSGERGSSDAETCKEQQEGVDEDAPVAAEVLGGGNVLQGRSGKRKNADEVEILDRPAKYCLRSQKGHVKEFPSSLRRSRRLLRIQKKPDDLTRVESAPSFEDNAPVSKRRKSEHGTEPATVVVVPSQVPHSDLECEIPNCDGLHCLLEQKVVTGGSLTRAQLTRIMEGLHRRGECVDWTLPKSELEEGGGQKAGRITNSSNVKPRGRRKVKGWRVGKRKSRIKQKCIESSTVATRQTGAGGNKRGCSPSNPQDPLVSIKKPHTKLKSRMKNTNSEPSGSTSIGQTSPPVRVDERRREEDGGSTPSLNQPPATRGRAKRRRINGDDDCVIETGGEGGSRIEFRLEAEEPRQPAGAVVEGSAQPLLGTEPEPAITSGGVRTASEEESDPDLSGMLPPPINTTAVISAEESSALERMELGEEEVVVVVTKPERERNTDDRTIDNGSLHHQSAKKDGVGEKGGNGDIIIGKESFRLGILKTRPPPPAAPPVKKSELYCIICSEMFATEFDLHAHLRNSCGRDLPFDLANRLLLSDSADENVNPSACSMAPHVPTCRTEKREPEEEETNSKQGTTVESSGLPPLLVQFRPGRVDGDEQQQTPPESESNNMADCVNSSCDGLHVPEIELNVGTERIPRRRRATI